MVANSIVAFLITGAVLSALYALVAIGFTMIFGVGGVLNLAHGALFMISAYVFLAVVRGMPNVVGNTAIAFLAGIAVAAIASYVLYLGIVQYIEDDVITTFIVTLLVALVFQWIITAQFTANPLSLPSLVDGTIDLGQFGIRTHVRYMEILGFVLSWSVIGLLWYYITRTDSGRSILATSMGMKGAKLTGINLPKVKAQTWLIAGALAGIAGVFLGNFQQTGPTMWLDPLVLAFIIVIIGGVGSIKGSIVAAYLIGYLETFTAIALGFDYRGILSVALVMIVILIRPEGLYGREYLE